MYVHPCSTYKIISSFSIKLQTEEVYNTSRQETFHFGLNPDDYNRKCSNNFFITIGKQTDKR